MLNKKFQFLIIIGLFILVNAVSYFTQFQTDLFGGKGYDGSIYYSIAEQFVNGQKLTGPPPYIYRIGTPFLVSVISGNNLMQGFYIANFVANFLSTILLFYFLSLYLKNFKVIIIIILLFLTHWLGNIRFLYYYPALNDYWGLVFLLLGLIIIEKLKYNNSLIFIILLSIVSFIGIFFREYLIVIPFAALFSSNPLSRKNLFYLDIRKLFRNRLLLFIPIAACISGIMIIRIITNTETEGEYFFPIAIYWMYNKSLIQYLTGLFIATGPAIVLLIFFYKDVFRFLSKNQSFCLILIYSLVLCYIGGSDTERFILWFIPIILLVLGVVIEKNLEIFKNTLILSLLIIFQCLANRVFFLTPLLDTEGGLKFPILTVIGNRSFLDLFSFHGSYKFEFVLFVEYCFVLVMLLMILDYFYFKKYKKNNF
ncbi:MAG: hypothetical protein M3R36_13950 [Bacteroidota bacterium]|nr:hypothetical protein [Bacteroidota bacterium]